MDNNDVLIRLRYALDIKNTDMIEMFKLGGVEVTKEELFKILTKSPESYDSDEDLSAHDDRITCDNIMLDSFLNGLITFKRGKQEPKPGQVVKPEPPVKNTVNMNNRVLKKVKIALSLTSEDMLDIFDDGGIAVSKGELGALLRKEGHKNYKECGDNFARKFIRGLTVQYRG
ncbi:DUF1456 family protein [Priestia koreensis]|uniref:DUF1456 family protein n=1 Tax=Priestia koreensis TaxID=284581 RepID=UPI001F57650F|nr:DUF1456 family protein [Priestia koreensis]MCM3005946.1 DUF1456 family protein [Priestia koreensis]UNL85289.1 DUF1456 family protein [Priestia koreensis]